MKAQKQETVSIQTSSKINVFPKYNYHIMNTVERAMDRQGPVGEHPVFN
jgi:hypothetical protein